MKEMENQRVELAAKQEESYRGRVNNLSQASHVLEVLHHKFNDAHLSEFRAPHFGHLESVHELSICREANQEAKVTRFMKKDFCLIKGLCCDEPYDIEVEPSNIRLLIKYFPQKFGFVGESSKGKGRDKGKGKVVKRKCRVKTGPKKATKKVSVTCAELETTFKQCEDEDAALKMGLVYFAEGVLIRAKSTTVGIQDIVPTKAKKNSRYWTWGHDANVLMPETLTLNTNDVEGKVREAEGSRGNKVMRGVDEVGFQDLVETVNWECPGDVCEKGACTGKRKDSAQPHRCPKFDHDDVVIYTPEGEHARTKMKVWYTRAVAKTGGTKGGK
ncbi:hypothetical protein C1H46_013802 [Malus baccata]|uniref:Uncharacterized protein n=1 Tax=Malus baccata TaxID=106549 RepID=A0A540MP32_MALBA|nr:hypothetical protein C1H46_013802 [Malus baccata]